MKQRHSKRLRQAQQIQRELQEVEVKQAQVEKDGVLVEKALRSGDCELFFFLKFLSRVALNIQWLANGNGNLEAFFCGAREENQRTLLNIPTNMEFIPTI